MKNTEQVLELVREERRRQDEKWGYPQKRTPFEWISILTEEVGELAQATNDAFTGGKWTGDPDRVRAEAVQVAAVAVSILEHLGWPSFDAVILDHAARVNRPAMDWGKVKELLDEVIAAYQACDTGGLALLINLYPLRNRYLLGERTRKLYDEINGLKI